MKNSRFTLTQYQDQRIAELVRITDKKTLAMWAIDCAKRVLPYFEQEYPEDCRPRKALETLQIWINTGIFKMVVIRKAALASHAAARETGKDNAARSAARAAGQAVATAHVLNHSMGAAIYSLQAVHRATHSPEYAAAVTREREWQYQHLIKLINPK